VAHHAVGGRADEVIADIRRMRGNDDEVGFVFLRGGENFAGSSARANFNLGGNAELFLHLNQLGLVFVQGVLHQIDRQVDGEIAGHILKNVEENDFPAGIEQSGRLGQNLLALFKSADINRNDNFLVHRWTPFPKALDSASLIAITFVIFPHRSALIKINSREASVAVLLTINQAKAIFCERPNKAIFNATNNV